jgi:hypothetical protein
MPYKDINEGFIDQGWQQMRSLLDKEMPVHPAVPVWKKWSALILLLFLVGILVRDSQPVQVEGDHLDGFPVARQGDVVDRLAAGQMAEPSEELSGQLKENREKPMALSHSDRPESAGVEEGRREGGEMVCADSSI